MKIQTTSWILLSLAQTLSSASQFSILNSSNFNSFTSADQNSLVLFYKENCPNCEEMSSIILELFEDLSQAKPDFKIAKIRQKDNKDFVRAEGVNRFPELRLYTAAHIYSIYSDAIEKGALHEFLLEHFNFQPRLREISEGDNLALFSKEQLAIYFSSPKMSDADKQFALSLSRAFPEIPVYIDRLGSPQNKGLFPSSKFSHHFLLKRAFDEGDRSLSSNLPFEPQSVCTLLHTHVHPRVQVVSAKNTSRQFAHHLPAILLFDEDYEGEAARNLSRALEGLHSQSLVMKSRGVEPNAQTLMDILGVQRKDFPALRVLHFGVGRFHRYKLDGPLTEDAIREFLAKSAGKELKEYFRSEEMEERVAGPVKKVVQANFERITSRPGQNTVVIFISESEPLEKGILEEYKQIGAKLIDNPSIFLGMIDMDRNDLPDINLGELPMIQVFKQGKAVSKPEQINKSVAGKGLLAYIEGKFGKRIFEENLREDL